MNLTERCGNLSSQLKILEQTKNFASQANHFEKRAEELSAASEELGSISQIFVLLRKQSIEFKSLSDLSLGNWHIRFADLRKKYTLDPESILNLAPGEDVRAVFLNPLKQLPVKIRAAMTTEWSSWATQKIPPINDELIDVLSAVASMKTKVEKLRALKRAAISARSKLPNSQAEIDRFLSDVMSISQAWGDLTGEGIPADVIDFLRLAGNPQGADISLLTAEVLKWLAEHHLDQTLRIRMT